MRTGSAESDSESNDSIRLTVFRLSQPRVPRPPVETEEVEEGGVARIWILFRTFFRSMVGQHQQHCFALFLLMLLLAGQSSGDHNERPSHQMRYEIATRNQSPEFMLAFSGTYNLVFRNELVDTGKGVIMYDSQMSRVGGLRLLNLAASFKTGGKYPTKQRASFSGLKITEDQPAVMQGSFLPYALASDLGAVECPIIGSISLPASLTGSSIQWGKSLMRDGRNRWLQPDQSVIASFDSALCKFRITFTGVEIDLFKFRLVTSVFLVLTVLTFSSELYFHHALVNYGQESAVTKVSLGTLAVHLVVDIYYGALVMNAGFDGGVFMPVFIFTVILKGVCIFAFQLRFIVHVWRTQILQSVVSMRRNLVLQTEAQADAWIRDESSKFVRAFSLSVTVSIFFLLRICEVLPSLMVLVFCFLWTPQMFKDVWQGQRNSIPVQIYMGLSATKLAFPLYMYLLPEEWSVFNDDLGDSVLGAPSVTIALLFVLTVGIQTLAAFLQSTYGPRCFVPLAWLPHVYDYHRPLPGKLKVTEVRHVVRSAQSAVKRSALGASYQTKSVVRHLRDVAARTWPIRWFRREEVKSVDVELTEVEPNTIGKVESDDASEELGEIVGFDCVICMLPVDINQEEGDDRRVVTPCDHVYHQACLVEWLNIKMECPTCRCELPPFP